MTSTPEPRPARSARTTRISRRTILGGSLGGLALIGGGSAWGLNRYVLDKVEVANASTQAPAAPVAVATADATAATITDTTYASGTAQISVTKKTSGTGSDLVTWYVADVKVTDATLVRSAFANDQFGQSIIEVPSVIAKQAGAVLAINGDYYGFRDTGIVIRNGVVYRDKPARQGLAFYTDGSMKLYDETATDAKTLVSQGVWNTLSFGPGLVDGGAVLSGIDNVEIDTNFGNRTIQGNQPRTGVGILAPNHFVFVVVDGRADGYSRGLTMTEFAQLFVDLGASVAYNLDGGGSSTMIFNDTLVNNPRGRGEERGTSDILYIAG